MEMTQEKLKALRTFFGISTISFEFADKIAVLMGGREMNNPMLDLHKKAKEELDKEEPDLKVIDSLLAEMELLATRNHLPRS